MATPFLKTQDVYIALILDKSGSMARRRTEVIEGVNTFVSKQRELPGNAKFSLTLFDTTVQTPVVDTDIKDFNRLDHSNYVPGGNTALYDAIAQTIWDTHHRAKGRKVLIVIVTDGEENASRHYNSTSVKQMIETRQGEGWDFTYIGAAANAWDEAQKIGIGVNDFVKYNDAREGGTISAFTSATVGLSNARLMGNKLHTDYRKEADK